MKHIKKLMAVLLAAAMLLGVAACSGGDDATTDPNLGLYDATTGSMYGINVDIKDVYEGGFSIELKAKNKCTITVDGESANGKYTLEDTAFSCSGGGVELAGTVSGGVMTLEDVMGSGLVLTLVNESYSGPAASPVKETADAATAPEANSAATTEQEAQAEPAATEEPVQVRFGDITETVIVDDAYALVTVTSLEDNGEFYSINLTVENKSDVSMHGYVDCIYINTWYIPCWMYEEFQPGTSTDVTAYFEKAEVDKLGIDTFDVIDLYFGSFSATDYKNMSIGNGKLYPMGDVAPKTYEREPGQYDILLEDNDNFTLIMTYTWVDNVNSFVQDWYFKNKTDEMLEFYVNKTKINGIAPETVASCMCLAGYQRVCHVEWLEDQLSAIGITDYDTISEVELTVSIWIGNDMRYSKVLYDNVYTITY